MFSPQKCDESSSVPHSSQQPGGDPSCVAGASVAPSYAVDQFGRQVTGSSEFSRQLTGGSDYRCGTQSGTWSHAGDQFGRQLTNDSHYSEHSGRDHSLTEPSPDSRHARKRRTRVSNGDHHHGAKDLSAALIAAIHCYTDPKPDREEEEDSEGVSPKSGKTVVKRRWLMLFYLAMLNLLSDWTCYSIAPIQRHATDVYDGLHPTGLVSLFLLANVCSTMMEPFILQRCGLRITICIGAVLMFLGSLVKSGVPPLGLANWSQWGVMCGFFLVGLAQPLFQCTPALFSSTWFPAKERTVATAVALNANQVGIGISYWLGTFVVKVPADDVPVYFWYMTLTAFFLMVGVLMQLEDCPEGDALKPHDHNPDIEPTFQEEMSQIKYLCKQVGFLESTLIFVCGAMVVNTISSFMDDFFVYVGYNSATTGSIGARFQFIIMLASFFFGWMSDATRRYWSVTMLMLLVGGFFLAVCGTSLDHTNALDLRGYILIVGAFVGPLQPIATETAVEVSYPCSENTVLVVQQLAANLASALFIPLFASLRHVTKDEWAFSFYLLTMVHALCTGSYLFFRGSYRRLEEEIKLEEAENAEDTFPLGPGIPNGIVHRRGGLSWARPNGVCPFNEPLLGTDLGSVVGTASGGIETA